MAIGLNNMSRWSALLLLSFSNSLLAAEPFSVPQGFVAETVYTVPKATQGSWVSLAVAPNGDLVAGDQGGGLWRIVLTDPTKPVVTPIPIRARGAHGLLFVDDALYLIASEGKENGIWRLRDTKGKGSFDDQVLLRRLQGSGEHGPHQLVLDRDGTILVIAGNHTKLPDDEIPGPKPHWAEDTLLERFEDPNGHAVGIRAVGGWIARMNKDGTGWQRVTVGMRNAYDLAVAPDGDIFTYDSDMEWDMGAPWYRPTRVNLATPGGELGWRSGSANNPGYMVDTQPALVDTGPGSPTGVTFGLGAKFPAKYQRALFVCDWTFGTLYAVHMTPSGGGWAAEKEVFAFGKPFALTDAVIRRQDGALYVTVGGRGGQSSLYRIRYVGNESTQLAVWHESTLEQKLRRELEVLSLEKPSLASLTKAWPLMGHQDVWIRYAARSVVEAQPLESWRKRVGVDSSNVWLDLNAALALARCSPPNSEENKLTAQSIVARTDILSGSLDLKRAKLRILQVLFARLGPPTVESEKVALSQACLKALPSGDTDLDRQYALLALYLSNPDAPKKVVALMRDAKSAPGLEVDAALIARNSKYGSDVIAATALTPNYVRIGLAVYLARTKVGWTPELRREFFGMLDELGQAKGGHSLKGFVANIRKATLENTPIDERAAFAVNLAPAQEKAQRPSPVGPGRAWNESMAQSAWQAAGKHNFENGRKAFQAALCSACHRVGDLGATQAPDLSGVGARMSPADLLQSILAPNVVVSDQYAHSLITLIKNQTVVGRIVSEEGDKLNVAVNPFDPANTLVIHRSDIQSIERSATSPMPVGLVNALNEKELTDLIAYLLAGGNKADRLYQK